MKGLFHGDSYMARQMSAVDWSKTPLGPPENWPQSLCTAARIILASRYPMFVWWGKELVNLYNDAYAPFLGERHPDALGKSAREVWADVWSVVGPQAEVVMNQGHSTWNEEMLLVMTRHGYTEETYFTWSYSPAPDDSGEVGGVFCAVTEDTARVLSRRRLRTLSELGADLVNARNASQVCELTARALAKNHHDIPFSLLYLVNPDGRSARLACRSGIESGLPASPREVNLETTTTDQQWPFRNLPAQGLLLTDLPQRFGDLPGTPWPEPATRAMVIPISLADQKETAAFLILGISPRRPFDDEYRSFMDLVAGQVTAAMTDAHAYETEQQKAATLAELDRAKTVFFSNISHEFRTPLTLMLGPLEELQRQTLPASAKQDVDLAHRNSIRLLKLVNTLLEFARIEAARVQAVFEPTDLAAMTTDLASAFRSAIEKAGLRFVVDCPPLPQPVPVDRGMWEKIVLNLLSNAFKFTFDGEIGISLRPAGDRVELTVRDTGTGISETELPRIFDRFHRVANSRSRSVEGTGIGLALVQELVKCQNGTIRVSSVQGRGTTFVVSIPSAQPEPASNTRGGQTMTSTRLDARPYVEEALSWLPEEKREAHAVSATAESIASEGILSAQPEFVDKSRRVLVADDNSDMRDYLVSLLSRYWTVEAMPDGLSALAAAQRQPPDLVLSDVMMPEMDGFELLQRLRADERTRSIPFILVSARAGEEARIEGLEAGADDYLIKPFSARELVTRVRSHLQLARMRREAEKLVRESESRLRNAVTGWEPPCWPPRSWCSSMTATCAMSGSAIPRSVTARTKWWARPTWTCTSGLRTPSA